MSAEAGALLGAATRWAGFLGALLATGAVVFRFSLLPGFRRSGGGELPGALERAATVGLVAALLLAVAAPIRLYAQVLGFVDPGEPITGELVSTILRETAWGRGWVLQVLAAGLAVTGFFAARAMPRPGWLMSAAATTAVVLAAPLTGHATASERAGGWGYPLDVAHLLGTGAWLGTLALLVAAGLPAATSSGRERESAGEGGDEREGTGVGGSVPPVAILVRAFSPIALTGAGVAILAGLALAFRYLDGSLTALWTTDYGRVLLLKLGVLGVVIAIGATNWKVITPKLDRPDGATRIRRSSVLELLFGTVLLAVTAVLVSTGMPGE
ncbi:MAG TPA: CopD family protein [Gemmatimonadales bacterium]